MNHHIASNFCPMQIGLQVDFLTRLMANILIYLQGNIVARRHLEQGNGLDVRGHHLSLHVNKRHAT